MARLVTKSTGWSVDPSTMAKESVRKMLAEKGAEMRDEILEGQTRRSGGITPMVETYVDGRETELLASVQERIEFVFNYLEEIVGQALQTLKLGSPVDSGAYRDSHFLMVNGERRADLHGIDLQDEIIITNDRPYARKIQVGAMKMSVPAGVYESARQALIGRFGNVVGIDLRFLLLPDGYILKGSSKRKDRSAGRPITYPSLVIRPFV